MFIERCAGGSGGGGHQLDFAELAVFQEALEAEAVVATAVLRRELVVWLLADSPHERTVVMVRG